MKKDSKVLLIAIVIILVALVSLNLNDLTGMIPKASATTITVSPLTIKFGLHDTAKMITIRVSPSEGGIDKKLEMYKCRDDECNNALKASGETANACTNSICYDDVTISYRISASLKTGKYYFIAKDRKGNLVAKSGILDIV